MPNTVTNRQLFFILLFTMTAVASVDISKLMLQAGGAGGWITILLTALLFGAAAFLWAKLNGLHEGKTLFEYSRELIGKAGSYILTIYFTLYFFLVLVYFKLDMGMQLQANFLPNTPLWATALVALIVSGFVAYKGVTNVARLIEIYGIIFLLITLPTHALMVIQGDVNFILPLYNPQETGKVLSGIPQMIFPFLGIEVLAVIPFTAKNSRKAAVTMIGTIIAVGLFYVFNALSSIMMIGDHEILHYNYPLIAAIRQVQLSKLKVFQRIDLLYLTVGFIALLSGLSIFYLNIVEYLCRMLPKAKRLLVTAIVGFAAFLSVFVMKDTENILKTLTAAITLFGVFAAGVTPAALLIIAKVKNRAGKKA